ncbi:MAG: DNA repair protein RadA [Hydrogenobaculum sp.]|nr:MAG: DNA repair protein RadA [Hydrogenobaculum sp.]
MAKEKTTFVCQNCGQTYVKWVGRCSACGEWNTVVEEKLVISSQGKALSSFEKPIKLIDIEQEFLDRISTGYKTLDMALGGGIVKGQVILLSGEPGIGKSTLLLKIADFMSKDGIVIYASGEESSSQISIRANRMGVSSSNLFILNSTNIEHIISCAKEYSAKALIVDSIQTMYTNTIESSPGSVAQVRESTFKLVDFCKNTGIPCFIVGHINKEGMIAGPKVLEHMVDSVCQFEGERFHLYRVLMILKNRYGATGEMAVFKMEDQGLTEVLEPSLFFLSERKEDAVGSVIFPHTEGTKPILVEIQALVLKALYTTPQRKTQGFDVNRLAIILGVLEKEARIFTRDSDVYVNVVGGIEIREPACDLAIAIAIASSKKEKPILKDVAIFGEIGLGGEIRAVHHVEPRLKELERFGIKRVILPKSSIKDINNSNLELLGVSHILEAIELAI